MSVRVRAGARVRAAVRVRVETRVRARASWTSRVRTIGEGSLHSPHTRVVTRVKLTDMVKFGIIARNATRESSTKAWRPSENDRILSPILTLSPTLILTQHLSLTLENEFNLLP